MTQFRLSVCAAIILTLAAGCRNPGRPKAETKVAQAVEVVVASQATVTRSSLLFGTLQGERQAMVMSKIVGKVTRIAAPEGSRVSEGDPILYVQNDIPGMDYQPGPVVAPVAGVVGKVYVEVGSTVAPTMPVAAVASFRERVKVKAAVSDADLPFVRTGAEAEVTVSALPGRVFAGRVTQVSPMLDPLTRSATVEITVANQSGLLVPGMSADARLTLERKTDVLALPLPALFTDGRTRVVVVEGTTARFRDITTGLVGDEMVEVVSGLEPGARVATTGKERVKDGDAVNVVEATQ